MHGTRKHLIDEETAAFSGKHNDLYVSIRCTPNCEVIRKQMSVQLNFV